MALEAKLAKYGNDWILHIIDNDDDLDSLFDADAWTECVEWTVVQLASQPRVRRMAYDMWFFERKHEAEKFKTFWALKWAT